MSTRSRVIPRALIPVKTRDDSYNKAMMLDFKKKTDEHENQIDIDEINDNSDDNSLKYDKDEVFEFCKKANNEIDLIKNNNTIIEKDVKEYESFKKVFEKFKNLVDEANKIYENLSIDSQRLPIKNKLKISKNILIIRGNGEIDKFLEDVHDKIFDLNERLNSNITKICNFKKLVLRCIGETSINYNVCNVCVTNKIDICINPCGHTFCSSCVEKMYSKCGMCRGEIKTKIKMYIENDDDNNNNNNNSSQTNIDNFGGFQSSIQSLPAEIIPTVNTSW